MVSGNRFYFIPVMSFNYSSYGSYFWIKIKQDQWQTKKKY